MKHQSNLPHVRETINFQKNMTSTENISFLRGRHTRACDTKMDFVFDCIHNHTINHITIYSCCGQVNHIPAYVLHHTMTKLRQIYLKLIWITLNQLLVLQFVTLNHLYKLYQSMEHFIFHENVLLITQSMDIRIVYITQHQNVV